jgi:hypothetical protein
LLERYHPVEIERRSGDASRAARNRGTVFAGAFDVVKPQFDRVPEEQVVLDSRVVLVRHVAQTVVSETLQRLAETEGTVLELVISAPDPSRRFTRTAYITAPSLEVATRMVAALEGKSLSGELLGTSLAPASVAPVVVPAIASTPLRLARDLQNAIVLCDALDGEAGILSRGWKLEQGTDASRLDVLIAYLRDVHLYCYYNWTQYDSVGQLQATCPVFYRSGATENVSSSETGVDFRGDAWAQTIDYNTSARASRAFNAAVRTGRTEVEKGVANLVARNCQPDGEGRFRCVECRKVFLTPEFVGKHLHNKHGDIVERCRTVTKNEQCFRNYFSDPDRVAIEDDGGGSHEAHGAAATAASAYNEEDDRRAQGTFRPFSATPYAQNVPLPTAPDPRSIRSYSEAIAVPMMINEEEIDYRLM